MAISPDPATRTEIEAAAFRALALGADGQRQFAEHGFLPQGTKD